MGWMKPSVDQKQRPFTTLPGIGLRGNPARTFSLLLTTVNVLVWCSGKCPTSFSSIDCRLWTHLENKVRITLIYIGMAHSMCFPQTLVSSSSSRVVHTQFRRQVYKWRRTTQKKRNYLVLATQGLLSKTRYIIIGEGISSHGCRLVFSKRVFVSTRKRENLIFFAVSSSFSFLLCQPKKQRKIVDSFHLSCEILIVWTTDWESYIGVGRKAFCITDNVVRS